MEKTEPIGRVVNVIGRRGNAEFTPNLKVGDYIYYKNDNDEKVLCQITNLYSSAQKGITGKFEIVNNTAVLPKVWDHLYKAQVTVVGQINVGKIEGKTLKFRLNPFFHHVLTGGKTRKGKTHVEIVLAEEFVTLKVPTLIIDVDGEFIHLPKFDKNAVVVEELRIEDLIGHLQQRHTVVLNLSGLPDKSKVLRASEILSALFEAKERDYNKAQSDCRLLEIPPALIIIDETELFAPEPKVKKIDVDCLKCIVNLVKRGGKYGIGVIVSSQRLPALHYDVRSQCGSALIFQVTDGGSITVLRQLPYITGIDLKRIRSLEQGICLITGDLVEYPVIVEVRDIETQRAKDVDFEKQLGIKAVKFNEVEEKEPFLTTFSGKGETAVTYDTLSKQFSTRKEIPGYPQMGKCLVIPERFFKTAWKNTLELQGNKVMYCPNMPGGSVYLVSQNGKGTPIVKTPKPPATRITGPCQTCGLPKDECICAKLKLKTH